ncbi:MAG: hypothetical protein GW762_02210 [Candidatus Pacebacteria bacterium]|nr:hypothetical protein [Candidatus Paceibacterota bacterium]PIR63658.1 MAG: hypothetical protein COU64_03620 [Candidatus Pacebacteria bacterium CG10_big_fil_rev_8_21_14_0_10_40_26]PIZ78761.1 MAG: hypothetical protein COY01_03990 [Candidatus Pacebacteria bacterium CG_4_10_14_0_2_um_filter_40_20]PJA68388.1 MAG: hypothetical protein CO156_05325 [Candidatus Pacebacteria bacterium CG_4_9_14_3_um_filter_40_12]PJC41250.1 MAG: hypothetical protein CO041_05395 [Candidatus Pacebacteria bacterium CG_4_9_
MTIDALRTAEGMITLLELDRVPVLADALELRMSVPEQAQILDELTGAMVSSFSPHVAGVVFSPEHTFNHISQLADQATPVLSLEKKTAAVDPLIPPIFVDNWGVESVSNNYGVAKLELYYNPAEEQAALKKQIVAEIHDYCKYEGIHFILELLVYHRANEKPSPQGLLDTQLTAVQEFRDSCDVLALEYLGDSLAAVTITAELDIPWILTGRDQDYEQTKLDLRAALEGGAQGFLLGDIFWPHIDHAQHDSGEVSVSMLVAEIQKQGRDHVIELSRITKEFASANGEQTT